MNTMMPLKQAEAAHVHPRPLRKILETDRPDAPLITPANCAYICDYAKKRAGLVLDKDRLEFIGRRLKPVARSCDLLSVDELVSQLKKNPESDFGSKITDGLTTNESLFFRDIKPFEVLSKDILPSVLENKKASKALRIWCAASATGQEPYSIAMTVKNNEKLFDGWQCKITATDISREALQSGEKGSYTQFDVQRGLRPASL